MNSSDEARRLAAVAKLRTLRHECIPSVDQIVRIATEHFKVPIALVSVVDADEQWFAARRGLELACTPRSQAFCARAIISDEVMVVEDATKDPRFADNPLVTGEPFIRFYAGAPLILEDGVRLGTVCILDRVPRTLTLAHRVVLRQLAQVALTEMRARQAA